MKWDTLDFKQDQGVATIKLNRPKAFNALSLKLAEELVEALEVCSRNDDIRAVIITGEGRAFCSGGDLAEAKAYLETDPPDLFRQLTKPFNRIIMDIRLLPKPVIAALNGPMGGGGFSLAAACDLRIAAASAKFRQAYTASALVPDGGFTLTVPLLIGFGRAMELVLLDPVIDAKKALEIGLVNQVVDDDQLEQAAFDMARKLAQGPTRAFAIAKESFNEAMLGLMAKITDKERSGLIAAAQTADYREGLQSFFEKRVPKFIGK